MNELDDEVVEHLLGDISFVESQKFSISLLFFYIIIIIMILIIIFY